MDNRNLTLLNRIRDSDIYFSFIKSPTAIISTLILIIIFFCSFFVELVTPYNPFDPSSLSLMDAFTPPSWTDEGLAKFILGTDGQGRDMLATILYGSRISLIVGFSAVIFALVLGVGVPPTTPSLGTLIRFGNDFLFSGEWWITFFPAIFLVVLALSINLLGDWMRDALNPKLKVR